MTAASTPEERKRLQDEARRRENEYVLRQLRLGGNLCHTGLSSYRFPPRPQVTRATQAKRERARTKLELVSTGEKA